MYSDIFCRVYNAFGWNYYPEAFGEQLLAWLKQEGIAAQTVLDMGCGTGILCRILAQAGLNARGMDLSPGMVAIAREENPTIPFDIGDMTIYCPEDSFDLVTCTGDALNHLPQLDQAQQVFRRVWDCLNPGGWFVCDVLNEQEVSDSEPFEMDFSETVRVWFQMTRPDQNTVNLCVRVWENGVFQFEENIRETLHDPETLCRMLEEQGFTPVRRAHRLTDTANNAATWYIMAQKGRF